jgi:hypothetical protein
MQKKMSRVERERWLFDFAMAEFDQNPATNEGRLIGEVWEFGHRKRSQPISEGGTITRLTSGGIKACTWKDVLICHERARNALEGLLEDQKTPKWSIHFHLQVESVGELVQETDSAVDAFTVEMFYILVRLGPKLASCPAPSPIPKEIRWKSSRHSGQSKCGKLFLRQRKDKKYCSYQCRLRVAMQRQRKNP